MLPKRKTVSDLRLMDNNYGQKEKNSNKLKTNINCLYFQKQSRKINHLKISKMNTVLPSK